MRTTVQLHDHPSHHTAAITVIHRMQFSLGQLVIIENLQIEAVIISTHNFNINHMRLWRTG